MKAASLILQFVIFFTIGSGFFLMAGNLFKFQSDLIKQDIIDSVSNLSVSEISASSIIAVNSCKSCGNISVKLDQKPIAGNNPTYRFSNGIINALILEIEAENKMSQSSMHGLNYSVTSDAIEVSSSKAITLTYDRTKNNLVMR